MTSVTELAIKTACILDGPAIESLYQRVHVHEPNLREKLDREHQDGFARTGGMFQALSQAAIQKLIASPASRVLVAFHDQQFAGYVAYRVRGHRLFHRWLGSGFTPLHSLRTDPEFAEAIRQRTVACCLDLIVHPDHRRQGIGTQLTLRGHQLLKAEGCTHVVCEIYSIVNGIWEQFNPNFAIFQRQHAGQVIGYRRKTLRIENHRVQIKSYIHYAPL